MNRMSLPMLVILMIFLEGCREQPAPRNYARVEGETMGTYYRVTYHDPQGRDFQPSLDSLLEAINAEVSTYIPTSTISRFNQAESTFTLDGDKPHFVANFLKSRELYALTDGAFDPTVMPLVNYWGFGYTPKRPVTRVDSMTVDSLLGLVGFAAVLGLESPERTVLQKSDPAVQLDFSAIAKGYAVDVLGEFLVERGVRDLLVDIGGEARAWGQSPRGDAWHLGVNIPDEEADLKALYTSLPLRNQAIATSGNYRNLYTVDGRTYSHTIHPRTGFPERNNLLSATILAGDCMTADALATACMVLGLQGARDLVTQVPGVEALLIFGDADGTMRSWATPGIPSGPPATTR